MEEIWLDISGYQGRYQISNLGNVKSLKRLYVKMDRILITQMDNHGYLYVNLHDPVLKKYKVHRLVAIAFLLNLDNKETVNHKNGIKTDNTLQNLEWNTRSENTLHKFRVLKCKHPLLGMIGKYNKRSKPILQYDLNNIFIREWENALCVQRELGFRNENINKVCNGKSRSASGYLWKFKL